MRITRLLLTTLLIGAFTAAPAGAATRPPTLKVISSAYGRILSDGRGYALYLFTSDSPRASRCYGACASAWPPFYSRGQSLRGAKGIRSSAIGTVRRKGGRRQVTYNGHPLYYYVGDRRPGNVFCQDVFEFGGRWLVLDRNGNAVR